MPKLLLTPFAVLLILLNLTLHVHAHTSITKRHPDADPHCGFAGNNDAYGLGIRLGIYIQWLTSAATSCLDQDGSQSVTGISNCYRLALFIGLLFMTIKSGSQLQASEASVMFLLGAGGAFTTVSAPTSRERDSTAALGATVQVLIRIALGSYAVWFFATGMDNMLHPPCSASGFLLVEVDLYGWARVLFGVIAGCHILVNVCVLLSSAVAVAAPAPGPRGDMTGYKGFAAGIVVLSLFVTGVELLIRWNHIEAVGRIDSTGQLLPLVVSLGTLVGLVWRRVVAVARATRGDVDEEYEVGVMA